MLRAWEETVKVVFVEVLVNANGGQSGIYVNPISLN